MESKGKKGPSFIDLSGDRDVYIKNGLFTFTLGGPKSNASSGSLLFRALITQPSLICLINEQAAGGVDKKNSCSLHSAGNRFLYRKHRSTWPSPVKWKVLPMQRQSRSGTSLVQRDD